MILAGDIGGTKTKLGIFNNDFENYEPAETQTYPSQEHDSLEEILKDFLTDKKFHLDSASFGVAGPVKDGQANPTNLSWKLDEHKLSQALQGTAVHLINDLAAIAQAVPNLAQDDLKTIKPGHKEAGGTIAVIAPGTGLGEAFLTWDGKRYRAFPSEGGHTDFGPVTREQRDLLTYLLPKFEHISYERVCSGIGIPNLYNFLRDTQRYSEPEWLGQDLSQAEDPTPIIVKSAQEKEAPIAVATLKLFIAILGSEAGNLALKVLATGGVFVGGGIPPRIIDALRQGAFVEAFTHKGRLSGMLDQIPVYVIRHPEVALYGAAFHAQDFLKSNRED
jgi:glucokinase